jgi:lycopene cyclase domain-containing protein
MTGLYLAAVLGSTFCIGVLDHRWRVFLFGRPSRPVWAGGVIAAGVAFFLTWDLVAIGLDIYGRGKSSAMTGVQLARDLPLEELFFIVFLCYLTMVLHGLTRLVLSRRSTTSRPRVAIR